MSLEKGRKGAGEIGLESLDSGDSNAAPWVVTAFLVPVSSPCPAICHSHPTSSGGQVYLGS